jgi:thioredoxin reductase
MKTEITLPEQSYEIIVIGGSYAGLSAAMSLGRALRKVLIIDSGLRCNRSTPHSHNFLTRDGETPGEIALKARDQVLKYPTVTFKEGIAIDAREEGTHFQVETASGEIFNAKKLIFTSGIKDLLNDIPGAEECWGKTIIHCPYCHGYEVRGQKTGLVGNGEQGFQFLKVISQWTKALTIFTNGPAEFTPEQFEKIRANKIEVIETPIEAIEHVNGTVSHVVLRDKLKYPVSALYYRPPFVQHSSIPAKLGIEFNEQGLINVDQFQRTNKKGIYAAGDNSSLMRSLSSAVSAGTLAGAIANKDLIDDEF